MHSQNRYPMRRRQNMNYNGIKKILVIVCWQTIYVIKFTINRLPLRTYTQYVKVHDYHQKNGDIEIPRGKYFIKKNV